MTIKLNAGCGDERKPGFVGLDIRMSDGTDVVCDLTTQLPFDTNSVSHIRAKSFLEHVGDLDALLREFTRVLTHSGTLDIYVPHWSNPFYFSDYTHKRFFGLATFDYFAAPETIQRYRTVPVYSDLSLETVSVRLLFKSPFERITKLLKPFQFVINRSRKLQIFYEFHLATIFPCYAIEYHLRKPSN